MEAIVLKVLKKYLKLFIKNFKSDNFSLSLLKGEGQLIDLELNENVIQELLLIPPQLRVTQASCDSLIARVPWTSYKKEPITISLNTIQINLKEPETITSLQPQFKKFKKKNKNKRNEVTENLQVEAKCIKLSIATMNGDSLIVEIEDVTIQSTNSNFQVVDLTQIKTIDKDQGIESLHKLISTKSVSIKIQDEGGMTHSIIDQLPIKVLYSSKRRIKDWIQLNAKVEFLLGYLNLRWTLTDWHLFSDLFAQFQTILARASPIPIPLTPASEDDKKSSKKKSKKLSPESTSQSSSLSSSPNSTKKSLLNGNSLNSSIASPQIINSPMTPMTPNDHNNSSTTNTPITTSTGINNESIPKHSDVTYDFHIDRWKLELIDNLDTDSFDSGFYFNGDGLHFGFTSNNVNFKPTNENNEVLYSLPIRESIVSVVMNQFQVQEMESFSRKVVKTDLCGHNDESQKPINKKYDASITSISSDGISERVQIHHYHGPYLLKGNLILRKPIITDSDPDPLSRLVDSQGKPLPPLIGLELNLQLSHFKLFGDRKSWKRFISFLLPVDNDTTDDETTEEEKENEKEKEKEKIEQLLDDKSPFSIKKGVIEKGKKKISNFKKKFKLGNNWKNQIKIILKASETIIIVPKEKNNELFKDTSTKIILGTFAMRNHSEWKSVPHLYEGLQLIDINSNPDPISLSGLDHRFTFKMENIKLMINESNNDITIIEPTTVTLYLRVSRSMSDLLNVKRIPKIDLSFISLDFNFRLTRYQSNYLDFIAKKYLSPKKLKSLMSSRIKSVAKKRLQLMKQQKLDKTLTIQTKVEKTLKQYYWNFYICIKKGIFYLPLQHLLEPKSKRKESLILTDQEVGISEDLCEFKVESLGLAMQNKSDGQNLVFKVGTFEATGIEHPKLTTSTTLCPIVIPDDEYIPSRQSDSTNLLITYSRRPKKANTQLVLVDQEFNEWLTQVNARLQGMQIKVIKKSLSGVPQEKKPKGLKIPDLQNFITKLISTWENKKVDINNFKKGIKKVKLDIIWGIELGNCEILLGNKSKEKDVYFPKGTIKITDTNRKTNAQAYKDIEKELLKKTLDSANSEMEKDEKDEKINELLSEIERLKALPNQELLQMKQEYMTLETRFIENKMALSEFQDENDTLKFELKKFKK